jgi:hypothetical protein
MSMCSKCGYPGRVLWTYHNYPELVESKVGNWVSLKTCGECKQLWVEVPHEPYAAFTFITAWEHDSATWSSVHDIDEGQVIREWHNAVIREHWEGLPAEEVQAVEEWRDRTYRAHNPIDQGGSLPPPRHIEKTGDLNAIIANI